MKMSIAQHKQCLANWRDSVDRKHALAKSYREDAERSEREWAMYKHLIDRAISEGKKEFDPDRYGKSRKQS